MRLSRETVWKYQETHTASFDWGHGAVLGMLALAERVLQRCPRTQDPRPRTSLCQVPNMLVGLMIKIPLQCRSKFVGSCVKFRAG